MPKTLKIAAIIVASFLLIFIAVVITTNILIKNKVENFLQHRLPSTVSQTYEDLILDTFEGTITILKPKVVIRNKEDQNIHTTVTLDQFIIEDVSYWDYFFNDEIHIEDIKLKSAHITYFTHKFKNPSKDSSQQGIINIFKPILIDELSIDNTTLYMYDGTKDSLLLYVENATIEIDDILVTSDLIKRRLPLQFSDYELEADSLFVKPNDFEIITSAKIKLKDHFATFNNIHLSTKYSKTQLSSMIVKERDHFNLSVPKLSVDGIDFGFDSRRLFLKTSLLQIEKPQFNIYRDKLVADDTTIKNMYSKSLRELPIALTIDSVSVVDAHLTYTERTQTENLGGTLTISNINTSISNLSNTYPTGNFTTIETNAKFMEVSPFITKWKFDVNNVQDNFTFTMDASDLPAEKLNPFTEPNLRVSLSGDLQKNYLTIDGNKTRSHFDIRLKYDDFKLEIMTKKGKKKNWFLSTVANIFVAKDSKSKDDLFREASGDVTRDQTKSIFNFLWLNTKEGLLKGMTGSN